jgi:hypothetical protein
MLAFTVGRRGNERVSSLVEGVSQPATALPPALRRLPWFLAPG